MNARKTLVLYHANCADGFGAAFAAWCALGDHAEYLPVSYGEQMPAIPEGSRVFIVDFSYPFDDRAREELCALSERVGLVVIDHHKTAREALDGLPFAIFDMEKSGAVLAWEYFREHPELWQDDAYGVAGEVPELLRYIQDRDLWRWQLSQSREFSAGLLLVPREFERWLGIIVPEAERKKQIIAEGAVVLKVHAQMVKEMCDTAHIETLSPPSRGWFRVLAVNTPTLQSEVCHELLRRNPELQVVGAYCERNDARRSWSLRSRPGFDCTEIATRYGGGGHPQAAGFDIWRP